MREAIELSDRVSVNLEAPSESKLSDLCPSKDYERDILARQRYVRDLSRAVDLPAGQETQILVGAIEESYREIYDRILFEYEEMNLRRVYFSAFRPVTRTAFEGRKKEESWREHRLYQVDWLHRVYKLEKEEILVAFDDDVFLRNGDPKEAIARSFFDSPIDPNSASYDELIRVPGIEPKSARRIAIHRKEKRIERMRDLAALGVTAHRVGPFLKVGGKCETTLDRWIG